MSKIYIDKSSCVGCGYCVGLEPEVFEMSEDGTAEVKENISTTKTVDELKVLCSFEAIKTEDQV